MVDVDTDGSAVRTAPEGATPRLSDGLPPASPGGSAAPGAVRVWTEELVLPTYAPDPPSVYPAYLDRRVYQGSSGRVYPLPFHDRISEERTSTAWTAVHLENDWLRVTVLPQLGGRIHSARHLPSGYEMFYRNDVVKPALVGLAGPWLAGGVEFNWPQHHRPATYLPTDVEVEREQDGAVTVWCSDHDPMTRMKAMHGVRLRPGRSGLEVRVRLHNRDELPRTFLWWANVAARVDEDYQSFFPRDVRRVADHARRAVTGFPAADRPYYGVDYPARAGRGTTASDGTPVTGDRLDWYRNIPVPTSYMALDSQEDFFGGYDHGVGAGFVHVADHHYAVGKKQWTWGSAGFGEAWCRNLADDGSAYVELMAGVFTDNQPDFAHLAPGETKVFQQTWFPLVGTGPVDVATTEAALRVSPAGEAGVRVAVMVTAERPGCVLALLDARGDELAARTLDLDPAGAQVVELTGPPGRQGVQVRLLHAGTCLAAWTLGADDDGNDRDRGAGPAGFPAAAGPATAPPLPGEVATVEELHLVAVHLQQYRHATRDPEPYWYEALRRDPGHAPSLTALAARAYGRDEPHEALRLLEIAVRRLTAHNFSPADTEAFYLLGLVQERLGDVDTAYAAYARASWARPWRSAAGLRMALLDARARRDEVAWSRVEDVLRTEPEHLAARALGVVLLRRLGEDHRAHALGTATLVLDPLHWWTRDLLGHVLATDAQTCLDVALEHAAAGDVDAALRVLDVAEQREAARPDGQPALGPLVDYHRADLLHRAGRPDDAARAAARARAADRRWAFPGRLADAVVLVRALERDPADPTAAALLGLWLYAHNRHDDAGSMWRRSARTDGRDPVVWRNLGLAAHNDRRDLDEARAAYDTALALAPDDAHLFHESDQLDVRRGTAPALRLATLLSHQDLVARRDDATVQLAHLLIGADRLPEARRLLTTRTFQPWEGGEGEVLRAWDRLALRTCAAALRAGDPAAAAAAVQDALRPPASLGEDRHPLASTAALQLALGRARAAAGDHEGAVDAWQRAADQRGDFLSMSEQPWSEASASSAQALLHLGRETEAHAVVDGLRGWCDELAGTEPSVDYFATSLPTMLLFVEDLSVARDARVALLRALLDALDGRTQDARARLLSLLQQDPNHTAALDLLEELR